MKRTKPVVVLTLFSLIILSACRNKIDHNAEATATKMNGVYVFIKSKPVAAYELLGTVDTKWYDRLLKPDQLSVLSIISDIKNSMGFNSNLVTIIEDIEQKYPSAEGIIFDDTMGNCDVIKFKK